MDQRLLPHEEKWIQINTIQDIFDAILTLAVRGAPMIGCAAAMSLAQWRYQNQDKSDEEFKKVAEWLRTARPTAVNLMYCVDKMLTASDFQATTLEGIACQIIKDEEEMCANMANFGASLVLKDENILTHCNTGSLATIGVGTALGVIRIAHNQNKDIHVYVDETRPLLQGGRLTAYELKKEGIPYTIIADNMAATLMRQGKVQRIFVGADRIALNGDFANKIGTYSLAVLAKYHNVPFYVVAPITTVDFECNNGDEIPIEERKKEEVHGAFGTIWAPEGSNAYNPAFDVTPSSLITGIILNTGIYTKEDIDNGALKGLKDL